MRKVLVGLGGALALVLSSAANATITVDGSSMTNPGVGAPTSLDGGVTTTISYGDGGLSSPTFTEWLTFTNTLDGIYGVSLDTSSRAVDFTSALLCSGAAICTTGHALQLIGTLGSVESWGLPDTFLGAGQYTLTINGNNNATGTLAGTVTITQAVPEPATWAMLLLGFLGIGVGMRRSRRTHLMQLA